MALRIVGMKALDRGEISFIRTKGEQYLKKLKRDMPKANAAVHVKKLKKTGSRARYEVNVKLSKAKNVITSKVSGWDLHKATHQAFDKLLREVRHMLKRDAQKQERFHPKKAKRGTDTRVKLVLRRRAKLL